MRVLKARVSLAARGLLAVLAIGAILGVAGRSLAPSVPMSTWLLWCAVGLGALAAIVVALLVVSLQFRQWALRAGGTDAQWFWFTSEPRGLLALREQQRSLDEQAKE